MLISGIAGEEIVEGNGVHNGTGETGALCVDHLRLRKTPANAFDYRNRLGRGSVVVADQSVEIVGVRTNHCDRGVLPLQRQQVALVLEQHE